MPEETIVSIVEKALTWQTPPDKIEDFGGLTLRDMLVNCSELTEEEADKFINALEVLVYG